MATELPVLDEYEAEAATIRIDEGTMADLGLTRGERIVVRGEDRTVASVDAPLGTDVGVVASRSVMTATGLAVGDTAIVEPASEPAATKVVLAPPRAFRIDGVNERLAAALEGQTVVAGDEVRVTLFGGSLEVRFVVTDVTPPDPAVVTPATEVVVRDDPASPAERSGTVARSFDDVAGLDDVVAAMRRLVTFPLEHPEKYQQLAGRAPGAVLLTGPTGSGKTLLARAVANETDAEFFRIPHADAVKEYEGGADGLASAAVREAPAVVVLDDVHEIAPSDARDETGGRTARVGHLLDTVADEPVVVLGTTSRPGNLAPSLRRGGRFEHEVDLGTPGPQDRLDILEAHTADATLAEDVDLASLADRTHGFVGADLQSLVAAAVRNALERLATTDRSSESSSGLVLRAADFETALSSVSPSGMQGLTVERPDVTYDDIGGVTTAKREVIRAIEWSLMYPDLLERVSTTAPSGILLHGLPGTGKTMLARAVANATDANFVAVQGPELLDRYVGESERGVREVFERAEQSAPSVVFFDEIDAIAPQRGGQSDTSVTERVVSQLLTELDGVEPREGVVVIGATNRPDIVDPALLRPGRLERVVEVPLPDVDAREEIYRTHATDVPTVDVDFGTLAARSDGYSGSDIQSVVREAGLLAVEDYLRDRTDESGAVDPSAVTVRQQHFERALDVVSPSISDEMRQRYADRVENMPNT